MQLCYNTLTELDLSNAYIGYRGIKIICKHLSPITVTDSNDTLQEDGTVVTTTNTTSVCNNSLISLYLRGNCIGNAGVVLLSLALKVCLTCL